MCLSNHLLKLCDEFYAGISEKERNGNGRLKRQFTELRSYLADETDGFGDREEKLLLGEVQDELGELMDLLSPEELEKNPKLSKSFDEFIEHLSCLEDERNEEEDQDIDMGYLEDDPEEEAGDEDDSFDYDGEDEWD